MAPSVTPLNSKRFSGKQAAKPALPNHLALIMDGNGRWAQSRGLPRTQGHRKGVEALRETIRAVGKRGIRHLTLFAFSSENWRRPVEEVQELMLLLRLFIRRDLQELKDNGVRVRIIGERSNLQPDILALLEEAEHTTRLETGQNLYVAFNYGGRNEIVRAARRLAEAAKSGDLNPAEITEERMALALDTAGLPDPDLIVRTSGEMRLSNFLLWQAAYAEFVFTPCMWPDFNAEALDQVLAEFGERQRRFGALASVDEDIKTNLPGLAAG